MIDVREVSANSDRWCDGCGKKASRQLVAWHVANDDPEESTPRALDLCGECATAARLHLTATREAAPSLREEPQMSLKGLSRLSAGALRHEIVMARAYIANNRGARMGRIPYQERVALDNGCVELWDRYEALVRESVLRAERQKRRTR